MSFEELGYCVVDSNLSTELLDFVTQYTLFDEISDFSLDSSLENLDTHAKYADPAMETLLLLLQKRVEEVTSLELFPTYSFFRVYRGGSELARHIDRESCEISITLFFGSSKDKSWPIFMSDESIVLTRGQMVVYRGCDIPHWRDSMPGTLDDWYVQGFFHYVDRNGPYSEFKWDKRESIGLTLVKVPKYIQKTVR